MQDNPFANFHAGFVAVMGKPNVGKSTLVNSLLGQKVAAVSPRPQTTRKRQMGILTQDSVQVIFIDTPGVHKPRHKLGQAMNLEAAGTLDESDVILFIVDASASPDDEDRQLADLLNNLRRRSPVILAVNKIDLVTPDVLAGRLVEYAALVPAAQVMPISCKPAQNLGLLLTAIVGLLPESPPFFPEDQLTDLYERDLSADLIREAALRLLRDEVPHGIAVRIDQFTERGEQGAYIEATMFVEKESHKAIVIGAGGMMLKQIGSAARQEIETMSGRKVYLQLRVKVRKNWRDDESVLKGFGF